ncbi:pesticin C-terminus-like muramidase [Pseudomonas oryzihabitans]|uniref:pesticin C-terminus-like muramidase n=1 Tax=Pseudomonas oryzihabitans TaxID=47885 RepID=UPI0015E387A4|nr:pesticin C-terminus-like muramidase [Pseudomonas psychrotolerans]MBA1258945.1 hypothetical protein [Pseudomonas psychrotolerans]
MTTNPTAPQPKVENWAYPFKAKGGQDVTDPQLYQQALAHAQGGTYLLGSNGLWHGGIHFDEGTSAFLDQSRIHCIADGEVVAYRIDDRVHRFAPEADSEGKTYSTSFVLIRHRLEAPQLPNGTETPPSLVFFSLYMHLLDWAGYEAKPTLPRPAFWGNDRYRVRTQGGKLNVRQEPRANAPVQAELANGSRIRIAGNGEWCEIIEILDNGLTLRPRRTQTGLGYVARRYLEPEAAPKAQNTVVVLDQPFPIKAGALLGHPGLYEGRQQIHLETFSCDDVPAFIERSRAWAVRLPESDKTLLKIHAGASKLITHRPEIDASHPPRIGDPGVQVGVDLILSQAQLDALPAADKITVAARNEGGVYTSEQRWWHLKGLLADANETSIEGWLCEQEFITSRHSPWEWSNYTPLQDSTSPRSKLAYKLYIQGSLSIEEKTEYQVLINESEYCPVREKLKSIIDLNLDKRFSSEEIKAANMKPWKAQSIGSLLVLHQSEWSWREENWNQLDELLNNHISTPNLEWEAEKKKIRKISWINDCQNLKGLSNGFMLWCFDPISFLGLLSSSQQNCNRNSPVLSRGKITFSAEGNDIAGSPHFSRKIHWPGNDLSGVTIGRGYDMGFRSPNEILNHMRQAGLEDSKAERLAGASNLRGQAANGFVRENRESIGEISREQQIKLFNAIYPDYLRKAILNYNRWTGEFRERVEWDNLDLKIQDILVDFVYQGFTRGANPMKAGMKNDKAELIRYIESTPGIKQYENGRHRAQYLRD